MKTGGGKTNGYKIAADAISEKENQHYVNLVLAHLTALLKQQYTVFFTYSTWRVDCCDQWMNDAR